MPGVGVYRFIATELEQEHLSKLGEPWRLFPLERWSFSRGTAFLHSAVAALISFPCVSLDQM
jgi:hypothetical protein